MASINHKFFLSVLFFIIKLVIKHPSMLLFFLLFPAGWYGYEVFIARPALNFQGVPQAQSWLSPSTWSRTLRSDAFLVGYSDIQGNPLWVTYKIKALDKKTKSLKRPSRFKSDWRGIKTVTHKDYTHSGYDRGHMAPNNAISKLYGKNAQLETFIMTNITPQKPNLNRNLWRRLESTGVNYFTQLSDGVWVTTGPIFKDSKTYLNNASTVVIPDAFYKIFAIQSKQGNPKFLAFLVPQTVKGNEPLTQFVVSIDTIEAATGLDFFHELEDSLENKLEAEINRKNWPLTRNKKNN
ncbi:MAG: DNA/RNA non-specific endonuclease [Methylococcales bacterium]|nr:DNA/RNA non-specific endonuclease [Methylococcales bacterium]